MSDEEKKAIDNMKSLLLYSKEHEYFSPFQEQEIDDMNIVLNLIEKQSKEIEELKYKVREHICIEAHEQVKQLYVSKDKIKAKIKECREILYSFEKELELKANKDKFIDKESMNCLLGQISVLQSLLEKE